MKKLLIVLGLILGSVLVAHAAPYPVGLGGLGTSQVPVLGAVPIGNGGGSYTPAVLTPGTDIVITNASGSVTLAVNSPDFLPSSTVYVATVNGQSGAITITSSTLGVATNTISLFNGNGFATTTIPSVLKALSASGLLTYSSSTGVFGFTSSTLNLGSASGRPLTDFLSSSTVFVASVNGQSGAVSLGIPATTTVNSTQASSFRIIGDSTTVTSTVNGATTTFSIINSGNWAGSWQGVNSTTFYLATNPKGFVSASGTNIFTGNITITGTTTVANLNGIIYFPLPSQLSAGYPCSGTTETDAGACLNDDLTALPNNGGTIIVPASSTGYSYSTPIVWATNGKYPLLQCAGGNATKFSYTGTGTSTAFTFDPGVTSFTAHGITNCWFDGNLANASTTGLQLGITNGAAFAILNAVRFTHFGTNLAIGNNTYLYSINDSMFAAASSTNVLINGTINAGENGQFNHDDFFNGNSATMQQILNCINITTGFSSLNFVNPSFDNCQPATNSNAAGTINIISPHIENPIADNASSSYPFINNSSTGVTINVIGGLVLNDASSDTPTAYMTNSGLLTLNGVKFQPNSGASAAAAVSNSGSGVLQAYGVINATGTQGSQPAFKTLLAGTSPNVVTSPSTMTPFLLEQAPGASPFEMGETTAGDTIFYTGTAGAQVGSISSQGGWNFGSGTTSTFKLRVAGSVSFVSSSTVTSAAIGGSQLSPATCASATTAIDPTIVSSTASFTPPTPKVDPGPNFYTKVDWISAGSVSVRLCAVATGTPPSTAMVFKIIN